MGSTLVSCTAIFPHGPISSMPSSKLTQPSTPPPIQLTVSAAASLQDVLATIAPEFNKYHGNITIAYNFASSGSLQQQIEQGAPTDLFFSAAQQPMDTLQNKNLILADSRANIVTNRLVLIAPQQSSLSITNLSQLKDAPITYLAVGEFRSVPAGQYGKQVFQSLDLLPSLQSKFVFSNDVRGVLATVASGNADVGLVYATDAARSQGVKVMVTIPEESHQPIVYPIAIVSRSEHPEAARLYIDFLKSPTAQDIFQNSGFGPHP